MPTCLYFAYGSNMMTARLKARCPSAIPVGVAFAEDHRLTFWKKGRDGSGKGHLASSPGMSQPGVLFTLAVDDLIALDEFEGVGNGYRRADDFIVRRRDTNEIMRAKTYLATALDPALEPYDWYLALVLAGAREHGFDAGIVRQLAGTACRQDPEPARATRHEAIGLFTAAGTTITSVLAPAS
ncbi:gamma-glutamylcyclotransferase [Nordella sp. HKS 07]|uniref:gamma-glutamylcyclotransferase family protein n=1 Tax=Nordella sp. HKS 07 TaxID=2712222 RepID=UPI0013E0EE19|nr:gamma-glutamylcyclotransferase family protein [Nordella sp. HKS 07]QIG48416.1 gamma-glutamylcyclotransferase [Nordella sp. HKS 07]